MANLVKAGTVVATTATEQVQVGPKAFINVEKADATVQATVAPQATETVQATEIVAPTVAPAPQVLTLKLARIFPDGGASYTVPGLVGTIYFKQGHFTKAGPPATLTLAGFQLGTPVAPKPVKVKAEAPNAFAGIIAVA